MKIEDQVCSLELANRLKELGVKQESYFDWYSVKGDREKDCYVSDDDAGYGYKLCSAFTVAELGVMLPGEVLTRRITKGYQNGGFTFKCYTAPGKGYHHEYEPTEADARASMVCYLIEKGLIDAKKIN